MSSKSARGFADSVTRRLEALEKNIMPVDDSSAASMNELLDELAAGTAPTTPKPKKDKAADPELEKLLEAYAKYKMQSQNKDEKEKIEEIIL
jgi:predicted metal-dependent peptidase